MNLDRIRQDFAPLSRQVNGHPLVYLDSAATSLTPTPVVDAVRRYFDHSNANVHRGVHTMAEEATAAYEGARDRVARHLNVDSRGVVFTRGATEALNLMAYSYARRRLQAGDEILTTCLEHHSNTVPWLEAARVTGAEVVVAPSFESGAVDVPGLLDRIGPKTRMVVLAHRSNVLGVTQPVADIAAAARTHDAITVIDGAQMVPHRRVDLAQLGVDAYAFTGHKALGPTGVGVLWARPELLEEMDPFLGGGEMIRQVSHQKVTWNDVPWKFEAGTPPIAEVIGLGAAIDYLNELDLDQVATHELHLTTRLLDGLADIKDLRLLGTGEPSDHHGIVAFRDEHIHPHDVATILDQHGVAVRAGHHCAQPLMEQLGVDASLRASLHCYNTGADVDRLLEALLAARSTFRVSV